MLQDNRAISSERASSTSREFSSPAELLDSFVHFLRQQYLIILFTSLFMISLGALYLVVARPSYTAVATMLIDARKTQFLQQQPQFSDAQADSAVVESQVRVLNSDNVALAVIKNLQLTDDPEFTKSSANNSTTSAYDRMRSALTIFKSRLNVAREGTSYVIEVSFRSYDPEKAARIANAVVDAYIVDQLDAQYQSTLRASDWLQGRIRDLRDQASAAEQAVVDYQQSHNIVDTAGKTTNEQQVGELNSQLLVAKTQMAEARAKLDQIQAVLTSDSGGAVDATVADTLKNDVVTKLRSQYLDLASKERDWAARYGNDHLAVVNLRNQMAEISASIIDELRQIAETYKSDFAIAKQHVDDVQKEYDQSVTQFQQNNQAKVVLNDLKSKAKTYRELYENFLQRYMESVQQQSFPITQARIISPALRPLQRSNPKIILTMAITACAGLLLGMGAGVIRDLWDRVFRTSDQVETILHVPCISLVPSLRSKISAGLPNKTRNDELSHRPMSPSPPIAQQEAVVSADGATNAQIALADKSSSIPATELEPRTLVHGNDVLWTVADEPFSRFAESLRLIKVAADLSGIGKSSKIIGFTSSLPNEGKSTLAASLGLLIAQSGGRAILVDGDLRNPSLTRLLAPDAKAGFIELISEKARIEDVLWWSAGTTHLAFLPAVLESRVAHTNEILASAAAKNLFDELRERYEYIIVDLSPLAPVVDVRTTSHFIDSYVCVVEWGHTKTEVVKRALTDVPNVYENLLGVVLNKAEYNKLGRYDVHRGDYYYNKHYGRYGYGA
jgi:succinoglycan biosynthesis transport protein ExoP